MVNPSKGRVSSSSFLLRSIPLTVTAMNLTIDAAQNAVLHPSAALQDVLSQASREAQAAISETRSSLVGDDLTPSIPNGQQRGGGERVQVVDEEKKFRYVQSAG